MSKPTITSQQNLQIQEAISELVCHIEDACGVTALQALQIIQYIVVSRVRAESAD